MSFKDDVGDPLRFPTHLSDCLYRVLPSLKLPLSCEIVEKVDFGPLTCRGQGIPPIMDMHFQIALTSEHVTDLG